MTDEFPPRRGRYSSAKRVRFREKGTPRRSEASRHRVAANVREIRATQCQTKFGSLRLPRRLPTNNHDNAATPAATSSAPSGDIERVVVSVKEDRVGASPRSFRCSFRSRSSRARSGVDG
jgi:hypothetical protein